MSFVKAPPMKETGSHFLVEMVPNPVSRTSEQQQLAQQDVINQITLAGKDLFTPNPAVEVNGAVKSRQLYNRTVSIDDMAAAMDKYDLVLRVNLKGSQTAAAMATASDLRSSSVIKSPSGSFSLVRHGNYLRGIDAM